MQWMMRNKEYLRCINMCFEYHFSDPVMCNIALKSCIQLNDSKRGNIICDEVNKRGYTDVEMHNCMISYYGKMSHVRMAENVFENMDDRNVISYNSMMNVYNNNGRSSDAIKMYNDDMDRDMRNSVSYLCGIKACLTLNDRNNCEMIYREVKEKRVGDAKVYNALIQCFGSLNDIDRCESIFKGYKDKNIVTYNIMMQAYIHNNMELKAMELFKGIDIDKNDVTYIIVLELCMKLKDIDNIDVIHNEIIDTGINSIKVYNALIKLYGAVGFVDKALEVFNSMICKNSITYNSMLNVYFDNNMYIDGFELFESNEMKIHKNYVSFVIMMKLYTQLKDIKKGKELYQEIISKKYRNIEMQTAVINFLSLCGDIKTAEKIYINMSRVDTTSYNSMLTAYLDNKLYDKCLDLFNNPESNKYKDMVSYIIAFDACIQLHVDALRN